MKRLLVLGLLALAGTLQAQTLKVTPVSFYWSKVVPGIVYDTSFSIQNNSASTVTGTIENVQAPYSIIEGTSFSLAAQETKHFSLRFHPIDSLGGVYQDTIIVHSASDTDHRIIAVGTVKNILLGHFDVSSYSVQFSTIAPGQADTQYLTLQNQGRSDLLVRPIWGSTTQGVFTTRGGRWTVKAGQDSIIPIYFKPFTAGSFYDTLILNSPDSAHPLIPVVLHGIAEETKGVTSTEASSINVHVFGTFVEVDLPAGVPSVVDVFDVLGRHMYSASTSTAQIPITIAAFPAGMYFIEVRSADESKTVRFLK